jgi:hypothetical protein
VKRPTSTGAAEVLRLQPSRRLVPVQRSRASEMVISGANQIPLEFLSGNPINVEKWRQATIDIPKLAADKAMVVQQS